jgi:hypothetical protein
LPRINSIAIDEHFIATANIWLLATGGLSIASLNTIVALGETLYHHDKCLVARGGLSVATTNVWLL